VISLLLAFASSVPAAFGVEIGSPSKLRGPVAGSPGSPSTYQEVYFGYLETTEPVPIFSVPYNRPAPQQRQDGTYTGAMLWRVGGNNGNEITLISKYYPAIRHFRWPTMLDDNHFRNAGSYGSYVNAGMTFPSSDIRVWLNNDNTGVGESDLPTTRKFLENFTKSERKAVQKQQTVDSSGRGKGDVTNDEGGDYFWLLSGAEVQSGWFPNVPDRILKGLPGTSSADLPLLWSTRTITSTSGNSGVYFIKNDGAGLNGAGNTILDSVPIRPGFKLKLSSALMTSGVGAKDGEPGPLLESATPPGGEMKLTLISADLSAGTITPTSINGGKITFDYSDATALEHLSAVILDHTETNIKYYGKLKRVVLAGSGEAAVIVPENFVINPLYGDDKLRFFVEKINADNRTDLASEMIEMTVDGEPITITRGQSAPTTPLGGENEITGVDDDMEYKPASYDDDAWTPINGTVVSDIPAGNYEVRYKGSISGSTIDLASDTKQVTVTGTGNVDDDPPGGSDPPGKDGNNPPVSGDNPPGSSGGGGGGCEVGVGAIGLLAAAFALLMRKRG
jgi:hypothetical protein